MGLPFCSAEISLLFQFILKYSDRNTTPFRSSIITFVHKNTSWKQILIYHKQSWALTIYLNTYILSCQAINGTVHFCPTPLPWSRYDLISSQPAASSKTSPTFNQRTWKALSTLDCTANDEKAVENGNKIRKVKIKHVPVWCILSTTQTDKSHSSKNHSRQGYGCLECHYAKPNHRVTSWSKELETRAKCLGDELGIRGR